MKRCHFNSWVAKVFLFPSYKAITLVYNSFFKHKIEECKPDDINHECIHQIQQIECSIAGLILGIILWLSFDISFWWVVALVFGFFNLLYLMNTLMIDIIRFTLFYFVFEERVIHQSNCFVTGEKEYLCYPAVKVTSFHNLSLKFS
mgnify:CR=1 FL=1